MASIAIIGAVVAAGLGVSAYHLDKISKNWHEGEGWEQLFRIYDKYQTEVFGKHTFVDAESRFGSTRVYMCGDAKKPPVMLIHGSNGTAMHWRWLIPKLSEKYYVLVIGTIGDLGRSKPKDGLTSSLPHGEEETVEWFLVLKEKLGLLGTPLSLVGESYGSFLSSLFAKSVPKEVNKVICTAPAATFVANKGDKIWWAFYTLVNIAMSMTSSVEGRTSILRPILNAFVHNKKAINEDQQTNPLTMWDHRMAPTYIGLLSTVIAGKPHPWTIAELQTMQASTPMLLLNGRDETTVDAAAAAANAHKAGIPHKSYPECSHALPLDVGAIAVNDILDFLDGKQVEGATYP